MLVSSSGFLFVFGACPCVVAVRFGRLVAVDGRDGYLVDSGSLFAGVRRPRRRRLDCASDTAG